MAVKDVGWIWTVNLRVFMEVLSRDVGYSFDSSDWGAIEVGLVATNRERGPWFDYPVGEVTVSVAFEEGAHEMVSVRVAGDADGIAAKIAWLVDLLRDYEVHNPDWV